MGLGDRLGESGEIVLGVLDLESSQRRRIQLPIERWHEGISEPDLFGFEFAAGTTEYCWAGC